MIGLLLVLLYNVLLLFFIIIKAPLSSNFTMPSHHETGVPFGLGDAWINSWILSPALEVYFFVATSTPKHQPGSLQLYLVSYTNCRDRILSRLFEKGIINIEDIQRKKGVYNFLTLPPPSTHIQTYTTYIQTYTQTHTVMHTRIHADVLQSHTTPLDDYNVRSLLVRYTS